MIQAGTPPQTFQVFPSFQSSNVWLPNAEECIRLQGDVPSCGSSRGAAPFQQSPSPGFQTNMSSTWQAINLYQLGLEREHGITGSGLVGFEKVVLNDIELEKFIVTAYASPGLWLGHIGLLPLPINYSQTINSPSFLSTLKDGGHIPSLAYGYQAGASYRGTKTPASLVLGGYDNARASKPLTVKINSDITRALTVAVHDMVATNTLNGTLSLINNEQILAPLDTSIPEMWLPKSVCDRFESVYGLEYHEPSGRYVLPDSSRDKLRELKPVLTVTIGSDASLTGNTTTIQLPYAAFDLQAGYPIFANTTNYFPIRRADNDTQYAIGRAFLQEAYVGVDFESGIFNVSAAKWDSLEPEVITVSPRLNITTYTIEVTKTKGGISGGAIAGIVIGCVAAIALLIAGAWLFARKRKRNNAPEDVTLDTIVNEKSMCDGSEPAELEPSFVNISELPDKHGKSELREARAVPELGDPDYVYELPAQKFHEMPTDDEPQDEKTEARTDR